MHSVQKAILEVAETKNLGPLGLRGIGRLIGERHPQTVKYHLKRLIASGHLLANNDLTSITKVNCTRQKDGVEGIRRIPILGAANCGDAQIYADEAIEGYVPISSSHLPAASVKRLFFIRAVGNSMNTADVDGNGTNIEDGDYVLINGDFKTPKNGDYILSIIGEVANMKKFVQDPVTRQVTLISESTEEHAPIFIHPDDLDEYYVAGKIIHVFKLPKKR